MYVYVALESFFIGGCAIYFCNVLTKRWKPCIQVIKTFSMRKLVAYRIG